MNRFAKRMKWDHNLRETAWGWMWRLTVLVLPWQTRLLWGGIPIVGKYVPEETMFSFYLSWMVLLAATILACTLKKSIRPEWKKGVWTGLGFLAFASCFSTTSYTWQWWSQIAVLVLFVTAFIRMRVSNRELGAWFLLSLLPHTALGIWQYAAQHVAGSSWFGMSSQLPLTAGVSVIFAEGGRILRAYGGFPHPNIFGAWLALGLFVAFYLVRHAEKKWHRIIAWLSLASIPVVLILTFSRTAWLMAAFAIAIELGWNFRKRARINRIIGAAVLMGLAAFCTVVFAWPVFSSRGPSSDGIQSASVTERIALIPAALRAFENRPLTGYGPGSSLFIMQQAGAGPIAPHSIFLIVLLETGLFGFIGIALLLREMWPKRRRRFVQFSIMLFPALLFDHYLWSYWSGQVFLSLVFLFYFATED